MEECKAEPWISRSSVFVMSCKAVVTRTLPAPHFLPLAQPVVNQATVRHFQASCRIRAV